MLTRLAEGYTAALLLAPLQTKALTAGLVSTAGDALAQWRERDALHVESYNAERGAAFMTFGVREHTSTNLICVCMLTALNPSLSLSLVSLVLCRRSTRAPSSTSSLACSTPPAKAPSSRRCSTST